MSRLNEMKGFGSPFFPRSLSMYPSVVELRKNSAKLKLLDSSSLNWMVLLEVSYCGSPTYLSTLAVTPILICFR